MQIDMHYYGLYALAYASGMNPETAAAVATSSQFVDDLAKKLEVDFEDAEKFNAIATAHHAVDVENLDKDDQRNVWVPFHFLPGNSGGSFTERLLCTKDSEIARAMLDDALLSCGLAHGPYRIGIAAHVYADTFSHHGFSGVSSRWNSVDNTTINLLNVSGEIKEYIEGKAKKFFSNTTWKLENIKCCIAENLSGALGHGGVATYPDRPYLRWEFEYDKMPRKSGVRDNPATYLEACQALYNYFRKICSEHPHLSEPTRQYTPYAKIHDNIRNIIEFQGDADKRIAKWKECASSGMITGQSFSIPDYTGLDWLASANGLQGKSYPNGFNSESIYLYSVAAHEHLDHVIHHLLPKYSIMVS